MKHYAGKVKYTVEGWVERNMDRVPESFNSTLAASAHKVMTIDQLFDPIKEAALNPGDTYN